MQRRKRSPARRSKDRHSRPPSPALPPLAPPPRIEINVENTKLRSLQPRMKKPVISSSRRTLPPHRWLRRRRATHRQHPAESHQQSRRIASRQIRARSLPSVQQTPAVFSVARKSGRNSSAASSLKRKYAVAKCSSRIAIPVNKLIDLRSTSFGGVSRTSPVTLEKCSGNPPHHILSESDRAIFERNVDRRPIQRRSPHLIHPRRIEPDLPQLQIECLRRLLRRVLGSDAPAWPRPPQNAKPDRRRDPQRPASFASTFVTWNALAPSC